MNYNTEHDVPLFLPFPFFAYTFDTIDTIFGCVSCAIVVFSPFYSMSRLSIRYQTLESLQLGLLEKTRVH
jgi:hypothetical protein